jgi:hypothetical protein
VLIGTILYVVTQPKIMKNSNNLCKQQFLTHLTYGLCKISVIEYSYLSFNWTTL